MRHNTITPPPTSSAQPQESSPAQHKPQTVKRHSVSELLNPGIRIPESGPRPLKSSAEGSGQSLGGLIWSRSGAVRASHPSPSRGTPGSVDIRDGMGHQNPTSCVESVQDAGRENGVGDDDLAACDLLYSPHGDQRKQQYSQIGGRGGQERWHRAVEGRRKYHAMFAWWWRASPGFLDPFPANRQSRST